MQPQLSTEISESLSQFRKAWELIVRALPDVEFAEDSGLAMVWGNVPLSVYNAIWITGPIQDRSDLADRAQYAASHMQTKRDPGMLFLCLDELPAELRGQADGILGEAGLHPAMPLTGMAAHQLQSPNRSLPELDYRRVSTAETIETMSDINCRAYGFELEVGRASRCSPVVWGDDSFGYIAYAGGEPVATASTFPIDGRLYVALVATLPEAQRRGYAEAVMRHSLEEASKATGLHRTILHATEAGRPVYSRMGYHDTARFMSYMLSTGH
jgi:GNAT superfamily N-acetyltransferase